MSTFCRTLLKPVASAPLGIASVVPILGQIPSRTAFFRKKAKKDESDERSFNPIQDGPSTRERYSSLKKRSSVRTVKSYKPPSNMEHKMEQIATDVFGEVSDWKKITLDDRLLKFKFLCKCIEEFEHDIPNSELNFITDITKAMEFFQTEIRDTSSYEDISKLDLPRNLHIQMEPVRFHPDTDTMFGGRTAFPDRPTVVTSIKYKHKYKGHDGQHRVKTSR
ncbi:ribosomal L50, mitochondrial [Octopus vulgaris]|uniref:Ribosomal L50, mitochondrial n=2 Tax=Octopus TaxID=6643 RepID=A0AA36ARW2_OCTVU|nr:39S ribosomal protein L50, mitochondrial [Octopus sinensis]CAI9721143.1 ribosomal L50, mitochondrial [Octopus vulgaris]